MRVDGLRAVAVVFFGAGAVLAGVGNEEHARWVGAVAFACFAAGAIAFLRWRAADRARVFASKAETVLASKAKTPEGPKARRPPEED